MAETEICDNDGIVETEQGEECDDGNTNPNDECDMCRESATKTFC